MLHIEGGQGACPLKLKNFDNFKLAVDVNVTYRTYMSTYMSTCPLKLRNFDNFKSPVDQFKTFQVQNMDHFIFAWEPGHFSIFWEGGYSVFIL